jgi:hypothetical protein
MGFLLRQAENSSRAKQISSKVLLPCQGYHPMIGSKYALQADPMLENRPS